MSSASEEPLVTFTIKNPSKHEADAFKLKVPLSATLADIQRRIAAEYDGNPSAQLQTLIYAGKVLKDPALMVKDIVQQTGPAADGSTHSMHLVVRAPVAAVGSTAAAASLRPAQEAAAGMANGSGNGAAGPSQTPEVPVTPGAHASGGAPASAPVTVEASPAPLDSPDAHSRSDRSSVGGSSTSGQHDEGFSDGGVGPAGIPGFSAQAGMPPMVVFGTPGTSSGLLYTAHAGHGAAGQLGMMGALRGLSQPGASSSGGGTAPGIPPMNIQGIQHVPYPYMMNFMNPLMSSNMMTAAYQAAYSAALQSMQQQQQQQTSIAADPSAAAAAAAAASTSAEGAGTSTAGSEPGSSSAGAAAAAGAAGGLHPAPAAAHTPLVPLTAPLAPAALLYYPAAFQQAAMAAAVAAANQQQAGQNQPHLHPAAFGPPAGPFPMAAPFAVPLVGIPAHLAAGQAAAAAAAAGQAAGAGAAAVGAGGAAGNARVGLQRRFPQGFAMMGRPAGGRQQQQGQAVGPAGAAAGQGGAHPHGGHRRYRTRTITFRISMRTLLQMLVFGMVLYQHCTWPRLCILLFGSIILYITALWPPFRQFVVSLARPPQPEQLAQMRQRREQAAAAAAAAPQQPQQQLEQQQGAAGGQQQQEQAAGAPAAAGADAPPQAAPGAEVGAGAAAAQPGAAAAAGGPVAGGPPPLPAWLQQGLLREVLAVLVSFVTSLFPAWNYNAEDAAVFAAAQEMLAREEQQQRQQQGGGGAQGQAAGGGGGGAAGFP